MITFSHLGIWVPVVFLIALLLFAFEIWMIVDAALNNTLSNKAKAWWIIGMILIHPIVAIVYFFVSRRKTVK